MSVDQLSGTFAALADPTRRAILARLADGEATVNELAEPFPMTLQAVSKHLKVLERAGLIARGRRAPRSRTPPTGWPTTGASGRRASTGSTSTCARPSDDHRLAHLRRPARAGLEGVDGARADRELVGQARLEHAAGVGHARRAA